MTNKEKVLAVWPDAKHTCHGSIMGDYVWQDSTGHSPKLGNGDSEQESWESAARHPSVTAKDGVMHKEEKDDVQILPNSNAGAKRSYLPWEQEIPLPLVQASEDAKAKAQKKAVTKAWVPAFKHRTALDELESCRKKLCVLKTEITIMRELNMLLRKMLTEADPILGTKPIRKIRHAARYLRSLEGESEAVRLLFKRASLLQHEQAAENALLRGSK